MESSKLELETRLSMQVRRASFLRNQEKRNLPLILEAEREIDTIRMALDLLRAYPALEKGRAA